MITVSALNALSAVRHGFFTREGGVSSGLYASRNCGFSVGDDAEAVRLNRERCMTDLGMPVQRLVTVSQRHTANAVRVNEPFAAGHSPVADALVTTCPGLVLAVLTADCAPVLLVDPLAGVVAAAHAGWRGALGGVLEATLAVMHEAGAISARIVAGIGPCIAQRSYEVGPDFPRPFLDENENNQLYFAPARAQGRFLFDLPGYVARKLALLGVGEVMPTPCDTFYQEDRFFSHRRSTLRGEAACGRHLAGITLER